MSRELRERKIQSFMLTDEANISRASRSLPAGLFGQKKSVRPLEIRATSERGVPFLSDCEAFIFKFNLI